MIFMNKITDPNEILFRAIRAYPPFIKEDNSISSAAFKDKNGLSVDMKADRGELECVQSLKNRFMGIIVKLTVQDCNNINAIVEHCPIYNENMYHCEIISNVNKKLLTQSQAKYLANIAKIINQ